MSEDQPEAAICGDVAAVFEDNHGTVNINQSFTTHDQLHVHLPPAVPKPKVRIVIQPGPDCIGDAEKAKLKELVAEVVRLESLIKRTPRSFGSVWAAVNAKVKASSYHLIQQANYPKAEKFLREWIGRLSSAKSAPTKDPNWRNRKYTYIFTNVRQLGAMEILRQRLEQRFGSGSLKDLPDDDLEAVYRLVAEWKKVGHAPGQAHA